MKFYRLEINGNLDENAVLSTIYFASINYKNSQINHWAAIDNESKTYLAKCNRKFRKLAKFKIKLFITTFTRKNKLLSQSLLSRWLFKRKRTKIRNTKIMFY